MQAGERGDLSDVELGFDAGDAVVEFDDLADQGVELHFEVVEPSSRKRVSRLLNASVQAAEAELDTAKAESMLLKRALTELN